MAAVIGMAAVLFFVYGYKVGVVENPREFGYIQVRGSDMSPALLPGDWVLVDRDAYVSEPIERGDIVWFLSEGETEEESKQFLRVAGMPSESISFSASGELIVGGEVFTRHPRLAERDFRIDDKVPDPVPTSVNQYYLLGDNRDEAHDSRTSGPIEKKSIRGKAISILFPPNRVGRLEE